jgi:CheY-like chemotaxis protein
LTYVDGQVTFALSPRIRGISLARKILLADDSVTAQNMGRKILADAGYEVIAVNNGSAALKKIAELKPDLVILDVYMPGYSGLEVCQRLKESQETARIPVLLTVGKLEPFKPEEAQRVRAEGFIVKPFEASELLSALSKLEDKVVPRAEPSKPGRFARAMAAAEGTGRGSRNETSSDDNGWKSRIGFPKQKTEPEEKVEDEAPSYNPVNRNLGTIAETPLEKAAEKIFKTQTPTEETRQPAGQTAETSVDMAALAPAGLPKDVTPEEVAAIAAAAAQIQMASVALNVAPNNEHQVSETRVSEIASQASLEQAPGRVEATLPPPPPDVQRAPASPTQMEAKTEAVAENKEENKIVASAVAAVETDHRRNGGERPEETPDVPVTMAATAESVVAASTGGPRWTAVSVALEGEEATLSLDQEMRKAHASVAEEKDSATTAKAPEVAAAFAGNSSAIADAVVEAQITTISNPEPKPVPEPEPASLPEPAKASSEQLEAVAPVSVTSEVAPAGAPAGGTSPAAEFAQQQHPEPAPVAQFTSPIVEPAPAEAAPVSINASEPIVRSLEYAAEHIAAPAAEHIAEPTAEPKEDSETVKSTAAAWASWRQNRDTSQGNEVAESQPMEKELVAPESAPIETAALAVAAGAEQALLEAAAAPSGEAHNVASIVDSVLADLRPKLMEEISRKMSEKK